MERKNTIFVNSIKIKDLTDFPVRDTIPVDRKRMATNNLTAKTRSKTEQTAEPLALRVEDGAAYLGCTVSALRELARTGAVRSLVVGKRLLIPRVEIERYITERMR
jgi:excisionase family DNA binding protein